MRAVMNDPNRTKERDDVLFALHRECSNPTADQIITWIERYPQFADDIRSHAAIIKDWVAREGEPVLVPSEVMLSRGQSCTMDTFHKAQRDKLLGGLSAICDLATDERRRTGPLPNSNVPQIEADTIAMLDKIHSEIRGALMDVREQPNTA